MRIRKLLPTDALALVALRAEALAREAPTFAASPGDDVAVSEEAVRAFLSSPESHAVFGCFDDSTLVGMVGLARATKAKQRHKAIVWGMYVQLQARRSGVGRSLLSAAIEQGRQWGIDQLLLGVSEAAMAAKRLYVSAGFKPWGHEPRALQWQGRFFDEEHLILDLRRPESNESIHTMCEDPPT